MLKEFTLFVLVLLIGGMTLVLFTSCAAQKPHYPAFYSAGDSIERTCTEQILQANPKVCSDLGWCAQHGFISSMNTKDGELCVE